MTRALIFLPIWSRVRVSVVPLMLLYEVSLIAIWFTERKRAREAAKSAS